MKIPAIYIMSNMKNGTIYTGVTSNLSKRVCEHKQGKIEGFSRKYGCHQLVYYEIHESMESAIMREKQIKAGSRKKKIELIQSINIDWNDLYESIV